MRIALLVLFVVSSTVLTAINFYQSHVISNQRILIYQMTKNPGCMVDPIPVLPQITEN